LVEDIVITGIGWNHRRCWGPLDASIELYARETGVAVRWDRRSLYSFGEGDLSSFTDKYDLVIFDHPYVGEAARKGLLVNLSRYLSAEDYSAYQADSVGKSWSSYHYDSGVWALPIDTAAHTAAWRSDLMQRHGFEVPKTLSEVIDLARKAKTCGVSVGWPMVPTDLMCTLMSIAASQGLNPGHRPGAFLDRTDTQAVVAQLRSLADVVHPRSREWNPIRCLDWMRDTDEIVYVPYLFNYVNYTAPADHLPIRFGLPPQVAADHPAMPLLGGAGIGISAKSCDPDTAFAYAKYLCSPRVQSGFYVTAGGQPASRTAWTSDVCNQHTNGFFADTLAVMDNAFLRPRHPGFVAFFHDATLRLANVVHEGADAGEFAEWLNASYDKLRSSPATMEAAQ
jgi:multiple sugar transport system substrate-binding protein